MQRLSRHRLADYVANELAKGVSHEDLMRHTAAYLLEHGQADQAELLIRDITEILAKKHGSVIAEVVTARPLTDSLRKSITRFISDKEQSDHVEINESVDEDLIGGLIIRTPTAEYDSSIRTQLRQLREL
ncbi:hypothetical protein CYG49_02035 [Candidatus Saccharibacteria bacterium]|nr:MAG: hypothetical protein CYG49_02035 [Candidatus Saccharibacteria bacterium]